MKPPPRRDPDGDELGRAGEDLAAQYLRDQGYQIIERNYLFSTGEIDIIATDGPILAFVEVKSRSNLKHGPPELAVDFRKRRLLQRAAERFIVERHLRRPPIRYDVVTVVLAGHEGTPVIHLFKNAF